MSEAAHPWHGVDATAGQKAAMRAIADRIEWKQRSLLIADEIGMGKTLIAATLVDAVVKAGGRVAIVIPPGIGNQWRQELGRVDPKFAPLLPLRSIWILLDAFRDPEQAKTDRRVENRKRQYNARRLQKELPAAGSTWQHEKILLLSHNLARFQWTDKLSQRAAELIGQFNKASDGKRRYISGGSSEKKFARELAEKLFKAESGDIEGFRIRIKALSPQKQLDAYLGLALGSFDLVILDEAHKGRRSDFVHQPRIGIDLTEAKALLPPRPYCDANRNR